MDRRLFLGGSLIAGVGLLHTPILAKEEEKDADLSPLEDLMREHGVLNRVLLVYEELQRRIRSKLDFQMKTVQEAASIIHDFIENHHEKTEEKYVFPRLEKIGKNADLVKVLRAQHDAGRKVTAEILSLSKGAAKDQTLRKLNGLMADFIRMYRPHEAFEDTVVFPAFKKSLTPNDYDALGDTFEDEEREVLGKNGFEGVLDHIGALEKQLDIFDIKKFTP